MTFKHDALSAAVHDRVRELIVEFFQGAAGVREQSAILTGAAFGLAEIIWLGRKSGLGVEDTLKVWATMGREAIEQFAAKERAGLQ